MEFPENIGFVFNIETDEYEKTVVDGKLLIWKNINNWNWTLAYEDPEEYVHTLRIGNIESIELQLKAYWRNLRIDEILKSK